MTMSGSDSDQKKGAVPSWQLKASESSEPAKTSNESPAPDSAAPEPSHDTVLETARKFLEDEKVRNASTKEKTHFLKNKGFSKAAIDELLGASQSEADSAPQVTQSSQTTTTPTTPPQPSSSTTATAPQTVPSNVVARQSTSARDSAPIITYPEFLTTPPQEKPIITAQRLLTTLYVFGGLSAILYGTSTYLIAPMVGSLTESRHSLAETAQTNLDKLVEKLEGMVSVQPKQPLQEDDESDGDPTEMFHRDIGVQTSLPATPSGSRPQTPTPKPLEDQTSRMAVLTTHLKDLNEASTSEGEDAAELTTTVDVLREYLTSLSYVTPTYNFSYGQQEKKEENDKISELKASIRAVKGVLLSARSFPSSNRVR